MFHQRDLKLRRPPQVAPNWRASYRLQYSALVAIAHVDSSGLPLSDSTPLHWAEIVPVDRDKSALGYGDFRARGRMAVRLLMPSDLANFAAVWADAGSPLSLGCCVSVIDLRVFVP